MQYFLWTYLEFIISLNICYIHIYIYIYLARALIFDNLLAIKKILNYSSIFPHIILCTFILFVQYCHKLKIEAGRIHKFFSFSDKNYLSFHAWCEYPRLNGDPITWWGYNIQYSLLKFRNKLMNVDCKDKGVAIWRHSLYIICRIFYTILLRHLSKDLEIENWLSGW